MINYRCYLSYQRFSNGISCWRYEISMQLALRRLDDDWMTASTSNDDDDGAASWIRRCRCNTVGNSRSERHSLWSLVRAKRSNSFEWIHVIPEVTSCTRCRRDSWGNAIACFAWSLSLSLSLSLPSLPPSFCDVSTTNEFLVRVPTGTWRSIVFAVRQILDFDITGLIDEYDTNQPSRIGYFVWLPLPVHILSDTRQYPPLSHMCSPHQTSSR